MPPLFDDEDLPVWMQASGVTFRGRDVPSDDLVRFARMQTGETGNFPSEPAPGMPLTWPITAPTTLQTPVELPPPLPDALPRTPPASGPPQWVNDASPSEPLKVEARDLAWLDETPAEASSPQPLTDMYGVSDALFGSIENAAVNREAAEDAQRVEPMISGTLQDFDLSAVLALPPVEPRQSAPLPPPLLASDLPDWITDSGPVNEADASDDLLEALKTAPPASMARPARATDADLPDWMRDVAPQAANDPPAAEPAFDWLNEVVPEPDVQAQRAGTAPLAFDDDLPDPNAIPDWLRGDDAGLLAPLDMDSELSFPATGIDPAKAKPAEAQTDTVSSSDLDAMFGAMPKPTGKTGALLLTGTKPLGAPGTGALQPLEPPPPQPPSKPSGRLRLPGTGGLRQPDSGSIRTPGKPSTSGLRSLGAADSQPERPKSGGLRALFNPAQAEVSFDDTTIDELMGPPSSGLRLAEEMAKEEASQRAQSEAPSLLRDSRSIGKLPERPSTAQPMPVNLAPAADLPDFVQELRPADAPVEITIGGVEVGIKEQPLSALNDQLRQLRDHSRELPSSGETTASTEGALAEISGALAAVPFAAQSAQTATPVRTVLSDLQAKRVRALQALLEVEEPAAPGTAKRTRRSRVKLDRMVIAVLLFVVVTLPFLTGYANVMVPPDLANPSPEQAAVFNTLNGIQTAQPVLVAFEYGPSASGELDDLARVLLRELFRRGAVPVVVSTNPAGALHAESLVASLGRNAAELKALGRDEANPLLPRREYVILRYLPSGAAGVRALVNGIYTGGFDTTAQFSTDIQGQPIPNLVPASLASAPVLVLAETSEDVRGWAEQYRPPALATTGTTPQKLVFAVAVAADATAHAYAKSRPESIVGPLVGLKDATIYRVLRQVAADSPEAAALLQRWQSVGLAALVAGVLILLGAMFSIIGALRRRGAPQRGIV